MGFCKPTRSERCPQKRDAVALVLHGESRSAQAEGPGHGRVPTRAGGRRPLPTLQEAERPLSLSPGPWTPPHLWGVRVTAGHANEAASPVSEGMDGRAMSLCPGHPCPVRTGTSPRSKRWYVEIIGRSPNVIKSRGRPRAWARSRTGSTAEVEVEREASRLELKLWRPLEGQKSLRQHLGQSLTPLVTRLLGRQSGGGRDERKTWVRRDLNLL